MRSKWKTPKNWTKLRHKILSRDKWLCQVCGAKVGKGGRRAHVHHKLGRSTDALKHLITVCATCHRIVSELSGNGKALALNEGLLNKAVELAKIYIKAVSQ